MHLRFAQMTLLRHGGAPEFKVLRVVLPMASFKTVDLHGIQRRLLRHGGAAKSMIPGLYYNIRFVLVLKGQRTLALHSGQCRIPKSGQPTIIPTPSTRPQVHTLHSITPLAIQSCSACLGP